MRWISELMQLLMGMSIRRYLPAMGTAGLERSLVSGYSREPRPPPMMTPRTSFIVGIGTSGENDGCPYYRIKGILCKGLYSYWAG